jgi:hypothetical protein
MESMARRVATADDAGRVTFESPRSQLGYLVPAGGEWSDVAGGDNSPFALIVAWDGGEIMRSLSFGVGFGASDLAADASRQHLLILGHDGTLRGTTLRSDDTPKRGPKSGRAISPPTGKSTAVQLVTA